MKGQQTCSGADPATGSTELNSTLAGASWRSNAAAVACLALLSACASAPSQPTVAAKAGMGKPGAAGAQGNAAVVYDPGARVKLTEDNRWRLELDITLDQDSVPREGRFDFRGLRCGGTYKFERFTARGEAVLQQLMSYGNCVKECQLVLAPDFSAYREECRSRVTGSGTLKGASNLAKAADRSPESVAAAKAKAQQAAQASAELAQRQAAEKAAREAQDLAALRVEADSATLPARIEQVRANLAGRDAAIAAVLDANLAAFVAAEVKMLSDADIAQLRQFIATRSATATDSSRAASPEGLKLAEANLDQRLQHLARTGSRAELEAMLEQTDVRQTALTTAMGRLRDEYIAKREFAPLHKLYERSGDTQYVAQGQRFARTADDSAKVEAAAVKALKTPGWLFSVEVKGSDSRAAAQTQQNQGVLANFTSNITAPLSGVINVKLRPQAPFKPRHNTYVLDFSIGGAVERDRQLRSSILGNRNSKEPVNVRKSLRLVVGPPTYEATETFHLGHIAMGYLQSGSMGGYTYIFPTDDPELSVRLTSITAKDVPADSPPPKGGKALGEIDFTALHVERGEFDATVKVRVPGATYSALAELESLGRRHNAEVESLRARMSSLSSSSASSSSSSNSTSSSSSSNSTSSSSSSSSRSSYSSTTDRKAESTKAVAPGPEAYVCKIYCKSTSGPTIEREFRAITRREAAQVAGDAADAMCNRAGHGVASAKALPESQCWKK